MGKWTLTKAVNAQLRYLKPLTQVMLTSMSALALAFVIEVEFGAFHHGAKYTLEKILP